MRAWIVVLVILIAAGIAIVFGAQIYLYIRLLLGSDLLVTVHADKNVLALHHGEVEKVNFEVKGTANPFCTETCSINLFDVSSNIMLDNKDFQRKLPSTDTFSYDLKAPSIGEGQKLYRFEAQCSAIPTTTCRTSGVSNFRSTLVVMNYTNTEQEEQIKQSTKEGIENLLIEIDKMYNTIVILDSEQKQIPSFLQSQTTSNTNLIQVVNLNVSVNEIKKTWEKGNYQAAFLQLKALQASVSSLSINYGLSVNFSHKNLELYNNSISSLFRIRDEFNSLQGSRIREENYVFVQQFLDNASSVLDSSKVRPIGFFSQQVSDLSSLWIVVRNIILGDAASGGTVTLNESFPVINYSIIPHINYNSSYLPVFEEVSMQCCAFADCNRCCAGDECFENKTLYPIILLHGHSFNQGISAEFSFDTFGAIQHKLEQEKMINGGIILLGAQENQPRGILGQARKPMTFRASYYFDIYTNTKDKTFVETKEDNIDSYAIRLRDTIDTARYLSNKDKVVIVAHSMGGLVARRYMQIFGEDAVDKVIFISTPNHGISGSAEKYCNLFGASAECRDMKSNSLFINKLNSGSVPNVPVTNIIGTGCDTGGEDGDGIVTKSSAFLSNAKNVYVNGSCTSFVFFHSDIIDPFKYPEIYKLISQSVKQ